MADIRCLPGTMLDACSYLVCFAAACLLVEPAVQPEQLPDQERPVRWIMATHGHIDHICAADSLRSGTKAPLYIHGEEAAALVQPTRNLSPFFLQPQKFAPAQELLTDGQIVELEDNYKLQVIHTPGHSPGSVCLLLLQAGRPQALFTGDTLFAGSVGRTDLPGGSARQLTKSLQKLAGFDLPDIPVYPGHGPTTTWNKEKEHNFYLKRSLS